MSANPVTFAVDHNSVNRLLTKLRTKSEGRNRAAGKALREVGELWMTEAKERTPWKFGNLRSSGNVIGPLGSGVQLRVHLLFGGPAAPYAVHVHENLHVYHPIGEAKFLEYVVLERQHELPEAIARRMEKA